MVAIASTLMNVKKRFEYRISNDSTMKDYKISIFVFTLYYMHLEEGYPWAVAGE